MQPLPSSFYLNPSPSKTQRLTRQSQWHSDIHLHQTSQPHDSLRLPRKFNLNTSNLNKLSHFLQIATLRADHPSIKDLKKNGPARHRLVARPCERLRTLANACEHNPQHLAKTALPSDSPKLNENPSPCTCASRKLCRLSARRGVFAKIPWLCAHCRL